MSVVNQMLRDLEQRQTASENTHPIYSSAKPQRSAMPYIIIGCCFSVVTLVSFFAPALKEVLLNAPTQIELNSPNDTQYINNDRDFVFNDNGPTSVTNKVTVANDQQSHSATTKPNRANDTEEGLALTTSVRADNSEINTTKSTMSVARSTQEQVPLNSPMNPVMESKQAAESASEKQQATGMMVVQSAQDSDTRVSLLQDKARLALQMNQFSAATEHLENLLKLAPEKNTMRLLLGRIYFQQNRIEQALSTLQNTATESAIGLEYIAFRAQLLTQTGEHRAAIADYNRLSESQPNNVKWLLGSAVAYDQLQSYNEAIIAYENIALNPNLPENISTFVTQRLDELRTLI